MNDNNGLMISGRWVNKRTGKTVNVRDSIIDGDKMIVITDIGQISMQDFSREYIQASDEIYNESGQVIDNLPVVEDFMKMNEIDNRKSPYGELDIEPMPIGPAPAYREPQIQNVELIKKVFDKLTELPEVSIKIKWTNFPEQQLRTLTDFLDVDINDISKYILKNYVNDDTISEAISHILQEKLNKNT